MIKSAARLEIQTLGRLSITLDGKPVATHWPDETLKICFCSLLSPLDLYFSWDRISRAMLSVPDSTHNRQQLEENIIRPLTRFLIIELGFNPLLLGNEYMSIDQRRAKVDAFEFHSSAVEGLKELTYGNFAAAAQKLARSKAIYAGSYLPGMAGKIIANTRKDLETLYQKVIMESARRVAENPDRAHKQAQVYEYTK